MKWWRRGGTNAAESLDAPSVYAAAALVLAYPDAELLDRLPAIEDMVERAGAGDYFAPILAYLRRAGTTVPEERPEDLTTVPEERPAKIAAVPEERGTSVSRGPSDTAQTTVPEERPAEFTTVPEERGTSVSRGPSDTPSAEEGGARLEASGGPRDARASLLGQQDKGRAAAASGGPRDARASLLGQRDGGRAAAASGGPRDARASLLGQQGGGRAPGVAGLGELQATHVQEFDISRRHALHLTYWIDGDTRRRGESLLRYKQAYRDSGLLVDLAGELPDYLPMVLEFAVHDPERGRTLLEESRPALELLRLALRDDELPHEGVLTAICATLPGESPADRLSVSRMQGWQPPTETVGLAGAPAPYGSRLPLVETSRID